MTNKKERDESSTILREAWILTFSKHSLTFCHLLRATVVGTHLSRGGLLDDLGTLAASTTFVVLTAARALDLVFLLFLVVLLFFLGGDDASTSTRSSGGNRYSDARARRRMLELTIERED